ncbi:MAG: type II toxin-antitoxin system RelE/ParE family toxin [Pseudomonadota bacterium]
MIISFQHKGLRAFFETGTTKGIRADHAKRLRRILALLNQADDVEAVNLPGWRLHALKGEWAGFWSITVSGNWRVIFRFQGSDVELVDYLDYH